MLLLTNNIAPLVSLGIMGRWPVWLGLCCIAACNKSAPLLLGGIMTYNGPVRNKDKVVTCVHTLYMYMYTCCADQLTGTHH